MRLHLPDVLYLQAKAMLGLGQRDAARERLLEARTEAEAMKARRPLWPILLSLSQLEPDSVEAERLQRQARDIVETIANHIGVADLQASFLNRFEVRELL
jgi:hypothetical protein